MVDAYGPKKKKKMADACLFLMTDTELLGISLSDLLELGKDEVVVWESLSSPPFFSAKLPKADPRQEVYHHFVFNSELYVAIGGILNPSIILNYDICEEIARSDFDKFFEPYEFCEIYRFDVESGVFTQSHEIEQPPTHFAPCFVGNISSGDVYLLVYEKSDPVNENGLWLLSSSGKWESLTSPPSVDDVALVDSKSFVFQDKLFVKVYARGILMYCFDPVTTKWTSLDNDAVESFKQFTHLGSYSACFPSITMSRLSNCSVALSWSIPSSSSDLFELNMEAWLVNNQNGTIILRQGLYDCLGGIYPKTLPIAGSSFCFVDLGDGMVCALVYALEIGEPVLWISVFTLTAMEANIGINTGTVASPKDQSFLSVSVLVKRVFTMKDHTTYSILSPFLFTPKTELPQRNMLASKVLVEQVILD